MSLLDIAFSKVIQDAVARGVELGVRRSKVPVPRMAFSVAEAGEAIGVSHNTIRRLIAEGELIASRCGENGKTLIKVDDLMAFLDSHRLDGPEAGEAEVLEFIESVS